MPTNTIDQLGDSVAAAKLIDRSIDSFIDDTVTRIGYSAFQNCTELTSVSFPAATYIGDDAFNGCSKLTDISFPLATSIIGGAFRYCSGLTSVSFPAVTSIGTYAFQSCTELTFVSLPAVTSIAAGAFQNCSGLTTLVLGNENQVCTLSNTNALKSVPNCIIYVPDALVDSYKAASNWSTYASRIKGISELPAT